MSTRLACALGALALSACAPTDTVTILHTNDWQSHMLGQGPNAEYTPMSTGDDATIGGLSRMKATIDARREASLDPVLVFDAGDWMAGALFQVLRTDQAGELQMMDAIGYDAVTIGNHEFDWGPAELGRIIARADELGAEVPIVASNIVPAVDDPADDPLEAHFDSGRIQRTMVVDTPEGLRVGVFGLLGDEAQSITPGAAPTTFEPAFEAAEAAVEELRSEQVDLVVAITHSGLDEDLLLADAVDGIDVIVGGHSHSALTEVWHKGQTAIVQAGANAQYVGEIRLERLGEHWTTRGYTLHELDDSIEGDAEVAGRVDDFVAALEDGGFLDDFGAGFHDPVATLPGDLPRQRCAETGLGDLITDAFREQPTRLDPEHPIDVAFESQGVYRDPFLAGASGVQGLSDVFRILPLGVGYDGSEGYSLVDFWVTGEELQTACEVTATVSPTTGCNFFIEVSGMRCHFDMDRLPSMRTTKTEIWRDDDWAEVDPEALYHVAVDSYVAELMSLLEDLSGGALVITPKHADGTPAASVEDLLFDADPATEGVQEYKLWEALRDHLEGFEDVDADGIPDVPERYLEPAGRIQGYRR